MPHGSRSVRRRLVLAMLTTTCVALVVAGGAMLYQDSKLYERTLLDDLSTQAEIVGRATMPALKSDDPRAADEHLALLRGKPIVRAAALYNASGALFATYARDQTRADAEIPGTSSPEGVTFRSDSAVLFKAVRDSNGAPLGMLYVKADHDIEQHLRGYLAILGFVILAALGISLVVAWWLQRTVTRPILAMRDVARQVVERRDYSLRATKTTSDEIGYLADAFNRMLSEIEQRSCELEETNASLAEQINERERVGAELKRVQDELLQLNTQLEERVSERTEQLAAANKELESFSYSVSHDLRAPVRAIVGFSKLLAEHHEAALDDEAKRKLGIVRSEAARMGTLIDDLLAFSRLGRQSLQMRSVDMEELVRLNFEQLKVQQPEARHELKLGPLPQALGDRSLLAQVWINLLSNALKFSGKKEKPTIEVNAISDGKEHTYFVRDNGAGFDPRYAAKLFGVFQRLHDQTDFPGTGVGLALVHRIITRHGGRVWAESKPDEGATFYFTLPRSPNDGRV